MKWVTAIFDKVAGASGLSWLSMLPWVLVAWGVSVAGSGAWAWHEASTSVTAKYEAQKAEADAAGARILAAQIAHAADVSLTIVTTSRDFLAEINLSRLKRLDIVKKVTADVRANAKAGCTVPAATRQLRDQQVDESTAIASQGHPM